MESSICQKLPSLSIYTDLPYLFYWKSISQYGSTAVYITNSPWMGTFQFFTFMNSAEIKKYRNLFARDTFLGGELKGRRNAH